MARKTLQVVISAEGRDQGKVFLITEMAASKAEKWAARAFLALAKSGIEVPDNIVMMGMAGIATLAFKSLSGISWDLAEPLLDEMFECVQIIPDPSRPQVMRGLVESDIEEVMTRIKLRSEVFELHTGFSQVVARFKSAAAAATAENASPSTQTSPEPSPQ